MNYQQINAKIINADTIKDMDCITELQIIFDKHLNSTCPLGYVCESQTRHLQTTMVSVVFSGGGCFVFFFF
jgi:hypothetical protein